ncbi:hypothetical protein M9H77_23216 [Catharanthus roseus]|uniref:Uncharacterized protein n=1 Tax=Catharanthus roseus TaxID=4058 RepID=A0ACC0AWR7_CATRO|nr:hypothetical protein M9H77_23216 [Catharanthus roseus]
MKIKAYDDSLVKGMVAFIEETMKNGLKSKNKGIEDEGKPPKFLMIHTISRSIQWSKLEVKKSDKSEEQDLSQVSAIDMEMSAHVVFLAGIDHEIPEHVSDDLERLRGTYIIVASVYKFLLLSTCWKRRLLHPKGDADEVRRLTIEQRRESGEKKKKIKKIKNKKGGRTGEARDRERRKKKKMKKWEKF